MYSKLEKVSDDLVTSYLTLLTDIDESELSDNPRDRQKAMALAVTYGTFCLASLIYGILQ